MHHINPTTKEVGICRSQKGQCPFDDGASHFENPKDAYLEAERRLTAEYGSNPSLKPGEMIETFEEFQARRWGPPQTPGLPTPALHRNSDAYSAMFTPEQSQLADYCRETKLNLEETAAVADALKANNGSLVGGPSVLITQVMQSRIAEANQNISVLDGQLAESRYFTRNRFQKVNGKINLESNVTVGEVDYITRMNEDGKISFGIYDHLEGSTVNAYSPNDFVDENQQPLTEWSTYYNSYRNHLHNRILWEKEKRTREERAGALRFP